MFQLIRSVTKHIALTAYMFGISSYAVAGNIAWNANGANAWGNGCSKNSGDTAFLQNGNDLSIIFSNMHINLNAGRGPLSDSRSCSFMVPFRVAPHFFPRSFTQTLTFGVVRTQATNGFINYSSSLFFNPLPTITKTYGSGQSENIPLEVIERDDNQILRNNAMMPLCARTQQIDDYYNGQLSLNGSRNSLNEDLLFGTDALDIRLEAEGDMADCNSASLPSPSVSLSVFNAFGWTPPTTATTGQTQTGVFARNAGINVNWSSQNATECSITSSVPSAPFPLSGTATPAISPWPFGAYATTITATCKGSQGRLAIAKVNVVVQ